MVDLLGQKVSDGWEWCRGLVQGESVPVDQSWVEYRGWRVDMDDKTENLRIHSESEGKFATVGEFVRRNATETLAWVEAEQHEIISEVAYDLWEKQGCTHGHDIEDWFAAKKKLGLPS